MQSARDTANINLTATLESNVLVFRGIFAKDARLGREDGDLHGYFQRRRDAGHKPGTLPGSV